MNCPHDPAMTAPVRSCAPFGPSADTQVIPALASLRNERVTPPATNPDPDGWYRRPFTVGSLFSGIGGLDLGLERSGMRVIWNSEINPYANRVLAKHWPDVPNLGDITTIDWSTVERPDLICGGYPCQPFSTAGRMAGADDPRHLWPVFADAIRHLRPRFVLLENVPAHLGVGFAEVLGDLAGLGFDAEWSVVPASAMGAPQRRPRLFVVAYRQESERFGRRWLSAVTAGGRHHGQVADAHRCRTHRSGPGDAGPWTAEPEVERLVDGLPARLVRPALYAYGNAVVPQVAEFIGRRLIAATTPAAPQQSRGATSTHTEPTKPVTPDPTPEGAHGG